MGTSKILLGTAGLLGILAVFISSAEARGRFGVSMGGPVGVHVGTNGAGVTYPTPQASVGYGDGWYDVSTTVDPHGVWTNASGPYGTSAGVSSDGDVYGGATESLPGGTTVSGRADRGGASVDATNSTVTEPTFFQPL